MQARPRLAKEGDRGKRGPEAHGEEYAWETDFRWLSAETALPAGLRLLSKWGTGTSLMGIAPPGQRSEAVVDILFDTFYLLLTPGVGTGAGHVPLRRLRRPRPGLFQRARR